MDRFFKYTPDYNRYETVGLRKVEIGYCYQFEDGKPLAEKWESPDVKIVANRGKRGDFPGWDDSMPVFSPRALQILTPLIGSSAEALPIRVEGTFPYYLINVLDTIDCIDLEQSKHSFNEAAGIITWLTTRVAKSNVHIDKHMFRNRATPHLEIYVSDEFKSCVENNKLKGLLFKEVTKLPLHRPQ